MNIEKNIITVAGIEVEVVRKNIKNLHLGVYPPHGRVRVAAPMVISNEAVRLAVLDKLAWIKRQKSKFDEQPRQSPREMVSGESHYYLGRRYRLRIHEQRGKRKFALHGITYMDLFIEPESTKEQREAVLMRWYREQLKKLIPSQLEKWQPLLGVRVAGWGIKRMKTKWGSCNREARRVWLNLELVKKPIHCLEYVVVHELMHLLERTHSERFVALMDQHLPGWRLTRAELQEGLLSYQDWGV
ncbi:M48 family metallopeptidase [Desulfofustis limnaeus]|uniref:Metal-dependent hydrolase n=1 Tax=Desulfofustis limnaeus TaxID=2740163 RepID=A0ABN6M382_9BACT|nr:SprT family zinc-dependent metalloprotease [Desulfofustis limnaeus]BDD86068.1 metal-dependent hydrolase [Desulfofustis limnaeus]